MLTTRPLIIFGGVTVLSVLTSRITSASPAPIATAYEEPVRLLHKAYEFCVKEISPLAADDSDISHTSGAFVRCVATNIGLWSDAEGYNAKRVAKFFIKQRNENEVMAVTDYCNQKHQQADLDLWAFEAYRCATAGRMGTWLREYLLSAKL